MTPTRHSRSIAIWLAAGAVAACTRAPAADLSTARPVMEKLLAAEREHRGSHGNFWRNGPPVDRNEAMKNLGIDLGDAGAFVWTMEPRQDGADTVLVVTARGTGGASSVFLSCTQRAQEPKADCKDSSGS
jgi:hypothetical protein